MNKIKQKILEFKQAPKRVQWLLMGVAFVVVLILLTMLVGKNDGKSKTQKESLIPELSFAPSSDIDFTDVTTGEQKSQDITVTSNVPVNIVDVRLHEDVPGVGIQQTCKNIKTINDKIGCRITTKYAPTTPSDEVTVPVYIDWYAADKTEEMKETNQITVKVSAVAPKAEPKPEPKPKPEPIVIPEPEPVPEPEPITVKQEIIREVETIAPSYNPVLEEPVQEEVPEACSDFAFPGYDNSGVQIGWIKPERGAYYFHPFSDKDCSEPTGVYNPDNGIITDIDNRGKRIGSDADHIGYNVISTGELPQLSNRPTQNVAFRAQQINKEGGSTSGGAGRLVVGDDGESEFQPLGSVIQKKTEDVIYGTSGEAVDSTQPYDRSFVLRQYKPIPATIVSDVRADADVLANGKSLPVRATVDRNVYSDDGRTIIIPTGTLMLGYVTGKLPGPYKAIGRMEIEWYQFILPNGVEFNFEPGTNAPFSADAQGRVGVPGRGSTDYMEQFLMPMLTAFVPATINLINPVADAFVNQIDLDNNTVVQSGTMRSSELAKNEIITAWNSVAQKLMVDMMDNTVPPFTIAAGTRITVYSPYDLRVVCTGEGKPCSLQEDKKSATGNPRYNWDGKHLVEADTSNIEEWIGQARAWQASGADQYCDGGEDGELYRVKQECATKPGSCGGYSYSTLKLWCESLNYQSKKALQYQAYTDNQKELYQQKIDDLGGEGSQQFNEEILGIQYNDDGTVKNPYAGSTSSSSTDVVVEETATMTCLDGSAPDANGCCAGEIYTDMGEQGFNCCPEGGGDCFPPMI